MRKVLIVDDERAVHQAIQSLVDWPALGLRAPASAFNGADGLARMEELQPAVVFVDMNMPLMNGADFLSQATARYPDARFIIVSGYDSFEYARLAIRLNVVDYLLKPIDVDELNAALKKALSQLPELPEENFLCEPVNRNTAPSVTWGCYRILSLCEDANVVISPSDQAVIGEEAFDRCMRAALSFVSSHDGIIAMGVRPSRPEPGYGYIQMGDESLDCNLHDVKSFTEKPEREFAQMFMDSGEFLWNTGIFVSSVRHLLRHARTTMPAVFRQVEADGVGTAEEGTAAEASLVWKYFSLFPNLSIDYNVLENADDAYVMLCDFGWADLGTWHSIYEAESHGAGDNVVLDSNVFLEDCKDNIIKLPKGRLGAFSNLEGYIVVENENVLMICKKGDSSAQIRKFVNEVQMRLGEDFI